MHRDQLSAALSALDNNFHRISGYDVVPEGVYWVVAEDVTLDLVPPSEHPRMVWKLRILGPDHYGKELRRVLLITPGSLRWLKRDLHLCGLGLESLAELPGFLANLSNLKLLVRKHCRSVHILSTDGVVGENDHLFLHLIDQEGREYLDQQLRPRQHPTDQKDFETLIAFFVQRYQCPPPNSAYLEDGTNGTVLFSTDALQV